MYSVPLHQFHAEKATCVHETDIEVDGMYGLRYLATRAKGLTAQELPVFVTGKEKLLHMGFNISARSLNRLRHPVSLAIRVWEGRIDRVNATYGTGELRAFLAAEHEAYLVKNPDLHGFSPEQLRVLTLSQGLTESIPDLDEYRPINP